MLRRRLGAAWTSQCLVVGLIQSLFKIIRNDGSGFTAISCIHPAKSCGCSHLPPKAPSVSESLHCALAGYRPELSKAGERLGNKRLCLYVDAARASREPSCDSNGVRYEY
ncbi:hypothetical protein B0H17DRAFT_399928 [Mycena rosella]|uniref:Uncharacterized protein n=1 Tax=Mycena rosella TaxID=1033263 RepID=A0AAD7DP76_MYCRO|nr:hypothetical protein B0H17DRAFT_399928 [Mycena rosella]